MKCVHCGADVAVKFGKDRKGQQRFRCLACRKTFVESHALAGMQTGLKEAVGALRMLLEGISVRAASRLTGLDRDTILRLMVQAGEQCRAFMEANIHDVKAEQVEIDEVWSFVRMKSRTARIKGVDHLDEGDAYTFTGMDRHSKLLLCFHVGKRDADHTKTFVEKLHGCVAGRPTICSDGFGPYESAITREWEGEVDYAQIVKSFVTPPKKEQQKYYPASIIRIERKQVCGNVENSDIGTSRMERMNLTTRMHNRRFTRLTNAHSKKWANHEAMLGLMFCWYNWCRKHSTIKTTPAVAAGLATEPWTLERLLTEAAKLTAA